MDELNSKPGDARTPMVLVVDDEETARTLLRLMLVRAGFNVLEAENGRIALRLAQEKQPDLVLLDVMMPGLDGFEVCAALKAGAATVDLPVIMLSARTDQASIRRGLEVGALRYLTKPISAADLSAEVQKVLDG